MHIHINVGMHLWYLKETLNSSIAELSENADSKFVTICHGEPWSGNIQYRYSSYIVVDSTNNQENTKDGEGKSPVEAVFGGINYILFRAYIGKNKIGISKIKSISMQRRYTLLQDFILVPSEKEDTIWHIFY